MSIVPKTLSRYLVARSTLDATWHFLRGRGAERVEGVVLWIGRVRDEATAEILGPIVPPQVAYRTEEGVAVEVTPEGLRALILALPEGVFVLCRVHSHPYEAFHSDADDDNMIISHEGAISIVVPDFGARPVDLASCSIHRLSHARGWEALAPDQVSSTFEVVDG